jgi:hypothetical protein
MPDLDGGPDRDRAPGSRIVRLDISVTARYSLYVDERLVAAGDRERVQRYLATFTPQPGDTYFIRSFPARCSDLIAAVAAEEMR